MKCFHLLFIFEALLLQWTAFSFTHHSMSTNSIVKPWYHHQNQPLQTRSQQRSSIIIYTRSNPLYAVKTVYNWRILPSGSLTGVCDDGIITTSALQEPASAKSNAIVTTASGSQYKLIGDPVGNKNSLAAVSTSSLLSDVTKEADTSLTTISKVALVVISGVFVVVVVEKLGLVGFSSVSINLEEISSMDTLSGRTIALIFYSIGITIATIQLINDANKLSKS